MTEKNLPDYNSSFLRNTDAPEREKPNTRGWWVKTILMLLLVALSIVLLFTIGEHITGEETKQLGFLEFWKQVDYPLFALLLGIILLYILTESGKYSYMLKVYTNKFHFRIAVKTTFLGKYYDGITPLSTGGQPFQILYLHKKNIPHGAATAIPVLRYIVSIFFLSVLSIILLAIAPRYIVTDALPRPALATLLTMSWISLGINILFPVAIILFSVFPKPCKRTIYLIIKLLAKCKIVKKKNMAAIRFLREMRDYSETVKKFLRQIFKFFPLLLLCILESLLLVTIPFFVVISVANVTPSLGLAIQIACLVIISRYTSLLVPTPGNTGAVEATSSIIFVTVTGIGSVIGWTVLVWRFLTYYVYILSGIGINIFEIIRGGIRRRRSTYE